MAQGFFQIERTDHAVFAGTQWQIDHGHRAGFGFGAFARGFEAGAIGTGSTAAGGVATIATTYHHLQGGEQIGQRPYRGGFAGSSVTQRQNAADLGVDGDNLDSEFHFVLADDGGEGEGNGHGVILSNAPARAAVRQ